MKTATARLVGTIVSLFAFAGACACAQEIQTAASQGDLDKVKKLVADRPSLVLECRINGEESALHQAAAKGRLEVAEFLIEHGADVNAAGTLDRTPLLAAAEAGQLGVVKLLLSKKADLTLASKEYAGLPLHAAAAKGHAKVVEFLLAHGADANAKVHDESALHFAAQAGSIETVKLLLAMGADPNAKCPRLGTPLRAAGTNKEVAALLLAGGARPDIFSVMAGGDSEAVKAFLAHDPAAADDRDADKSTALHIAARDGKKDLVDLLVRKGADVNALNRWGRTPLCVAANGGAKDICEFLLAQNADPNLPKAGENPFDAPCRPLHAACRAGHVEIARLLLAKGARPNELYDGQTALWLAAEGGDKELVELLLANKADPNAGRMGRTSLHVALGRSGWNAGGKWQLKDTLREDSAWAPRAGIARMLIENGADVNARISQMGIVHQKGSGPVPDPFQAITPLHLAADAGLADVVKLMLDKGADASGKDLDGRTALHYAARACCPGAVEALLAKGAKPNDFDDSRRTPLLYAVSVFGGPNAMLLFAGPQPNQPPWPQEMQKAADAQHKDRLKVVELLLAKGADPGLRDAMGLSAIDWAARMKRDDVLQLLKPGASAKSDEGRVPTPPPPLPTDGAAYAAWTAQMEAREAARRGRTPLHVAASRGKKDEVAALLDAGADVNARDNDGRTPLDLATLDNPDLEVMRLLLAKRPIADTLAHALSDAEFRGQIDRMELLIDSGASLKGSQGRHCALFDSAFQADRRDLVKFLIHKGADARDRGPYGRSLVSSALRKDWKDIVKLLLEKGTDLNVVDSEGDSPLALAVSDVEMMRLLLDNGAKPDLDYGGAYNNNAPLVCAARNGSMEAARMLIARGADLPGSSSANSAVHEAARSNHPELVKLLLDNGAVVFGYPLHSAARSPKSAELFLARGAKVNAAMQDGSTALHRAAEEGAVAVASVLLAAGADPNAQDFSGLAPLHVAARRGDTATAAALLAKGADVNIGDKESKTPLALATADEMRQLLAAKGGKLISEPPAAPLKRQPPDMPPVPEGFGLDIFDAARTGVVARVNALVTRHPELLNASNGGFGTPLGHAIFYHAASPHSSEVIKLLLDKGADPNLADSSGVSPLMLACESKRKDWVETLLAHGADPNTRTREKHETALHWAAVLSSADIAQLLLDKGVKANDARDTDGRTPLHWAAARGRTAQVKLLLEKGADPNAKSTAGQTPLGEAKALGKNEVADLLRANGAKE